MGIRVKNSPGLVYVIYMNWQDENGCGTKILDSYTSKKFAERERTRLQLAADEDAAALGCNSGVQVSYEVSPSVVKDMFGMDDKVPSLSVEYLYRDAANYKVWNRVVLAGQLTRTEIQEIFGYLHDGEFFIPNQVGLPEERFETVNDDDHVWFELPSGSLEVGCFAPTHTITARELLENFRAVAGKWDVVKAVERLGDLA